MRTRFLAAVLSIACVCGALTGCGQKTTAPINNETTDQIETARTLTQAAILVDDDLSGSESEAEMVGRIPGIENATAPIVPITFWRTITSVEPSFDFAFADTDSTGRPTRVLVTVHKQITGKFNVLYGAPPDTHVVHKDLSDVWTRRVLVVKTHPDGDGSRKVWRIAAVSAARVLTAGVAAEIDSVRIESTDFDTTITDPLGLIPLRRCARFAPNDSVRITVTTHHNDDVVLLHHHGHRVRFRNNHDNTYSFAFVVGPNTGWRHAAIDVLSHGSVFDDADPYQSEAWITPFRINTEPAIDYFP